MQEPSQVTRATSLTEERSSSVTKRASCTLN
jgi:hypothetical protein